MKILPQRGVVAIARLRALRPRLAQVVVKLDAGVSGEGNAIVELRGRPRPGTRAELRRIGERVDAMRLQFAWVSPSEYLERLERGGIVEERVVGRELRSPSVQLELTPGEARIVSTHDQILSGHAYVGCRFPAEAAYARGITDAARRVGALLAAAGAVGRAAIDFIVVRDAAGVWRAYAIELDLRNGGTTHPLAALELLTGGAYDPRVRHVPDGGRRPPALRGHGPPGVPEPAGTRISRGVGRAAGACRRRLWRRVPHARGLDSLGRVGLTAIGRSAADAQLRFEHAQAMLLSAAEACDAAVAVA